MRARPTLRLFGERSSPPLPLAGGVAAAAALVLGAAAVTARAGSNLDLLEPALAAVLVVGTAGHVAADALFSLVVHLLFHPFRVLRP